jgi:hypothetical protein
MRSSPVKVSFPSITDSVDLKDGRSDNPRRWGFFGFRIRRYPATGLARKRFKNEESTYEQNILLG